MEQKKKEHIKKMAADRRMAQKFFLIQVDLCVFQFCDFFSGNGDISNCGSWYCNGQKQTSEVDQHSVLG